MSTPSTRQLRLLLAAGLALGSLTMLWLLLGAAQSALGLWHDMTALPIWLRLSLLAALLGFVGASSWLIWRVLRPRPHSPQPVRMPDRAAITQRMDKLSELKAETAAFEAELHELDQRAASGECYVAVFGEISTGKSSLIRALAPRTATDIDVLGGTTTRVSHHRGELGARALVLADVPGSHEVAAREREQIARDEALRAHAVIYLTAGDLSRAQDEELRWLHGYGKPLLLVLNKMDQWTASQRGELVDKISQRYVTIVEAVIPVQAGGSEQFERVLADGRREHVVREAVPEVDALRSVLLHSVNRDPAALEQAREAAVLGGMAQRLSAAEHAARASQSIVIVDKYTRRAVVGALAAVAPGTDLLIQGALASGLVRELAALHAVPVKQLDLDAFLRQAALTLRTTGSLVLAIAGNALKAFPGLGTLGGGILHAVAYGLIFDSLGRAITHTLVEQQNFDQQHAQAGLQRLLADGARARLGHIASLALDSVKAGRDRDPAAP